jgi:hypothetical protein
MVIAVCGFFIVSTPFLAYSLGVGDAHTIIKFWCISLISFVLVNLLIMIGDVIFSVSKVVIKEIKYMRESKAEKISSDKA